MLRSFTEKSWSFSFDLDNQKWLRPWTTKYCIPNRKVSLTSKNGSLAGSSSLLRGPSSTVNPFLQKVIVWNTGSGGARAPGRAGEAVGAGCSDCRGSPLNVREEPAKAPDLLLEEGGCGGSALPSWAPNRRTRSNIASTSRGPRLLGSCTIMPLHTPHQTFIFAQES